MLAVRDPYEKSPKAALVIGLGVGIAARALITSGYETTIVGQSDGKYPLSMPSN